MERFSCAMIIDQLRNLNMCLTSTISTNSTHRLVFESYQDCLSCIQGNTINSIYMWLMSTISSDSIRCLVCVTPSESYQECHSEIWHCWCFNILFIPVYNLLKISKDYKSVTKDRLLLKLQQQRSSLQCIASVT